MYKNDQSSKNPNFAQKWLDKLKSGVDLDNNNDKRTEQRDENMRKYNIV